MIPMEDEEIAPGLQDLLGLDPGAQRQWLDQQRAAGPMPEPSRVPDEPEPEIVNVPAPPPRSQPGNEASGTYLGQQRQPSRQPQGGDIDFLGAIAAWTKNPALMQMWQAKREDALRERERPMREAAAAEERGYRRNAEQRAQEKWQQERDLLAPLKAEGMRGKNALGAADLQAKDPKSAYSKSARQSYAEQLQIHAQRLSAAGFPGADGVARMAQTIAGNDNLSAEAAERMMRGVPGMTDKIIGDARNAAKDAESSRMTDAKIGDMSEKNKIAWARINAARDKALQPKPSAREKAANAKMQEKLDDEIEKADWARNMLLRVADLKKNVNTGPLAGRLQDAAQTVGLSSKDFDAMKQTLSMVSNRIIKELSGSAVTGNEWSRMQDELANIMNDDDNFETKLANMIELTDSIKQRAINRYARVDGAPSNPTNTAKRTTAQAPSVMPGEKPPPDATPGRANSVADAQEGARAFSKSAGKYFVRKGGKWVPE